MAIYSCGNLLGCRTLLDWTQVRSELPGLFSGKRDVSARRKNLIIYFALQKAAPFHVCIAAHNGQYMLLHGEEELQILLDFILFGALLERSRWTDPLPFPGKEDRLAFSDISLSGQERLLSTKIPHCDFSVGTRKELESLQICYRDAASASICLPIR